MKHSIITAKHDSSLIRLLYIIQKGLLCGLQLEIALESLIFKAF